MPVVIIPMGFIVGLAIFFYAGGAVILAVLALITFVFFILKVIGKTPSAIRNKAIAKESGLSEFSKDEIREYMADKLNSEYGVSAEVGGDYRVDVKYFPGDGNAFIEYRPFTSDFLIKHSPKQKPNYISGFKKVGGPFLSPNEAMIELAKFVKSEANKLDLEKQKRLSSQKEKIEKRRKLENL